MAAVKRRTKRRRHPRRLDVDEPTRIVAGLVELLRKLGIPVHVIEPPPISARGKKIEPEWQKAIDDITAAFVVTIMKESKDETAPNAADGIAAGLRRNLPRARVIFANKGNGCVCGLCRHASLISAGCERVERHTGIPAAALFDKNMSIVEQYIANRN